MDLGNRIAVLREKRGLSQAQLADKLHISQGSLGMYETGKRKPNIPFNCINFRNFPSLSVTSILAQNKIFSFL